MTTTSFFWHDYETFGTDPQRDRVSQFAGMRTDTDFNPIGEPITLFCKPAPDYLPHPEACLITGITPQMAAEKGVCEAEFTRVIHDQLSQPGTCTLGYNNLRFDDEVTRNLLYRNFYDPYAREWQNGNSRWDLIDIARAARALRPQGINWPDAEDGTPSFRLEQLTQANDIAHISAHDALSDVYATLGLARLLKQRQPRLFNFLFEHKSKAAVLDLLQLGSYTPLVHISGRFPARNNCLAIVVPLCEHPTKSNEIVVYDVSVDPAPLLELSAEEIRARVFTASDALPAGVERIPLKTVHINKCPVLAPRSVIRHEDAERLQLDLATCEQNLLRLKSATQLRPKLAEVFNSEYSGTITDPDLMIYSGGFFSNRDKTTLNKIRATSPEKLAGFHADFDDARLPEMLFRYRARNWPESLSIEETQSWREFCANRLHFQDAGKALTLETYQEKIRLLQADPNNNPMILAQLAAYATQLQAQSVQTD